MKLALQMLASMLSGIAFFGVALFLPAGTFDYWQAWLFIAVFMVCTLVPSIYLAVRNPDALARRMKAGPDRGNPPGPTHHHLRHRIAGGRASWQSALSIGGSGGRTVPMWAVIVGQCAGGRSVCSCAQFVVVQNNYAAATITVEADQPLVSTGLYGVVRHPMYSAAFVMMIGTPLALGFAVGAARGAAGGAGARGAHPRRGEGAHRRTGRLPRVQERGALPPGSRGVVTARR